MLKLNNKGFSHDLLAVLFVVIFAIIGVGYLVVSHADTVAYTSTNDFSKFQYVLGSGTAEAITHSNGNNLLLQFNKGLTGYHPSDMAMYQFNLPANTTANSLTMNVSYVDAGYDTAFVATGSPTNKVWSVSNASTQTNRAVTLNFSNKPTVIYFGISARGSRGGFSGTFPANRNFTVNSYTLNGVTTTASQTPTVSLSANPTSVAAGGGSTLGWSSTNVSSCTGSGGWSGAKATSGSANTGALSASTTYTLSCSGTNGTNKASTTVNIAQAGGGGGGGGQANCTQTLSPGANIASAESSASAGAVICLSPGTYSAVTFNSSKGTAAAPITLTSADTAHPALIVGRTVTDGSASYLTISHLRFLYTAGNDADAVVLGTPHVNFVYNDVSGADQTICLNGVSYGGSTVSYSLIDHNTIHNCGLVSKTSGSNTTQGIYMLGGPGDVISNNWCWATAARCYQVRGEQGGSWHNNVSDNSGQGWIFGDVGAANNNVYNNIVGSLVGNGSNGGYSAFEFNSSGKGNSFHDNCVSVAPQLHTVATSNNTVVSVQFVDAGNHNYNLTSAAVNDPCRGYAVQGGNPGP
jgi:hypothetical protein